MDAPLLDASGLRLGGMSSSRRLPGASEIDHLRQHSVGETASGLRSEKVGLYRRKSGGQELDLSILLLRQDLGLDMHLSEYVFQLLQKVNE